VLCEWGGGGGERNGEDRGENVERGGREREGDGGIDIEREREKER